MGKVAITVGGILIAIGIIAFVFLILNRRATRLETLERGLPLKGDLTAKQERRLIAANQAAANVMHQLLWQPLDLTSQASFLSGTDRAAIEEWLQTHHVATS